ncbi:VWA domain-containing protein [Proteobacteria bacterium 005FR1]|nr:VWA domain-containing protein [Proteobacteria bacterium 005FR1]
MQELISNFHFLRPWWLLAIVPAVALGLLLWRQKRSRSQWQNLIQPELLRHLLEGSLGRASRWPFAGLITGWVIASIALAGPAWQQLPQPVHQSEAAVVVVFDMSTSMVAEDIKPSRLQRARYKLRDYLNARQEGLTALIAYAGEAHVVSPLTDDTETIANLLPALHPSIMPLPGSNVEMAIDKAVGLFTDAGMQQGEILLVTDEVVSDAFPTIREQLQGSGIRLSILGVGTTDGAPIPTGDGGFARSGGSDIVIARLNESELQELSSSLGGTYAQLRADDRDIDRLLTHTEQQELFNEQQRVVDREFDTWRDNGYLLALLLLPLAALAFRRGWLLGVAMIGFVGLTLPSESHAFEWRDLWWRSDQQGMKELNQGDPAAAAAEFESPDWRGTAQYRANNYPAAAESFARGDSATHHYNRGNALAKAGKLQEALAAYETALDKQAEFPDAEFNADLVRKLLEQQQQQQQQQSGEDPQSHNPQQPQSRDQQSSQQGDSQQEESESQQGQQQQQAQGGGQQEQQQQEQSSSAQASESQDQPEVDEQAAQALADRQNESDAAEQIEQQNPVPQAAQENRQEQRQVQPQQAAAGRENSEDAEQQQALEQWLRKVPDDPSGLLRRKFEYEHRRMRQQYRTGDWLPPQDDAYRRW